MLAVFLQSSPAPVSLRGTQVQRLLGEFVNGSLPPTKAECRCTEAALCQKPVLSQCAKTVPAPTLNNV